MNSPVGVSPALSPCRPLCARGQRVRKGTGGLGWVLGRGLFSPHAGPVHGEGRGDVCGTCLSWVRGQLGIQHPPQSSAVFADAQCLGVLGLCSPCVPSPEEPALETDKSCKQFLSPRGAVSPRVLLVTEHQLGPACRVELWVWG